MLVAQTWIDLRTQRLPRSITYTGIVLGGIALTITAIVIDEPERIWMMVAGRRDRARGDVADLLDQQGRDGRW